MPDYTQKPSGLFVPKHPSAGSGPRPQNAPGVGFGNQRTGREMLGGVVNPQWVRPGYEHRDLLTHIHGRIIAAAEVMTGVAFLRSSGWVRENDLVSTAKAAYQDLTGLTTHPRAHRFPCNPVIGANDIPQTAMMRSVTLGSRLKLPLAVTDFLPRVFNYADQLFEEGGGIHTVENAVRFAIGEQPGGRDVNPNLVRHSVTHILIPGFAQAYDRAYWTSRSRNNPLVPDVNITDPNFFQTMTDASLAAEYSDRRPLLDIETVQDILSMSVRASSSFVPANAGAAEIQQEVQAMQSLVPSASGGL